ncbi:MAG: diphthine--ammonia ligase [Thermoprotei archaeon]|nr:MAG: diphthine--ammonia ligase [Thermoprotei archaeon]RLF01987.1 MAG: diphthine--ammonia ligase [Thermoprotei archaeon]
MRVCVLYSGGKDSNLALFKAWKVFEVACLITLFPRSEECYLFHYPNTQLVKLQAEALNLPLITEACLDDEESNLKALYKALKGAREEYGIDGVVTGAIRSTYQASRFQKVCWDLGLWCFNPLWLRDEISLLKELLDHNFEAIFTRVAGYPLKKDLLGKRVDERAVEFFKKIRYYVNPSGEGGEYETFVLDMPLFKKRVKILEYEIRGEDYDATLVIKRAELIDK